MGKLFPAVKSHQFVQDHFQGFAVQRVVLLFLHTLKFYTKIPESISFGKVGLNLPLLKRIQGKMGVIIFFLTGNFLGNPGW